MIRKTILIFALAFSIFSCDKEDTAMQEMRAENIHFSECKNTKSATLAYENESIEYVYVIGDKLKLTHKNVYFNCCQPEGNLQIETKMSGDSLIVNEFEVKPEQCKCICPYDVECTLGPLREKSYWLIMKKQGAETFRIRFNFGKELNGQVSL